MLKPTITYEDFAKLDMRIGTIVGCGAIEGSEKLLKIEVDLGSEGVKTILSGIKKDFSPESLIGVQVLVLANLEPRKMMGIESQGMILMGVEEDGGFERCGGYEGGEGVEKEERITLLIPQNKVAEGTGVE